MAVVMFSCDVSRMCSDARRECGHSKRKYRQIQGTAMGGCGNVSRMCSETAW